MIEIIILFMYLIPFTVILVQYYHLIINKINNLEKNIIKIKNDNKNLDILTKNQYYVLNETIKSINDKLEKTIINIDLVKNDSIFKNELVTKQEFDGTIFNINDQLTIHSNEFKQIYNNIIL